MKRSEMRKRLDLILRKELTPHEKVLELIEGAGLDWDPEETEWPELVRVWTDNGPMLDAKLPEALSDADAERIAAAWNARRPGGEMEQRLREIEAESWVEDAITEALRLGVEGES